MSRAEAFTQALYEDAGLREDLTDEETAPLFKWAEQIARTLDETYASDEDFEAASKQLRQLIKAINKLAGQRSYAAPDVHQQQFEAVKQAALSLNLSVPEEPAGIDQADPTTYIHVLLDQIQITVKQPPTEATKPGTSEADSNFGGWRSWLNNLNNALSGDDAH